MFASPPNSRPSPRFRLDPWAVEFGGLAGIDDPEDEIDDPAAGVDAGVETDDWSRGIEARPAEQPRRIVFVDGVQRTEVWGVFDTPTGSVEAALASVAVGASVCSEGAASVEFEPPARVVAVSSGLSVDPIVVRAPGRDLVFEPSHSATPGRKGVSDALSLRRAELERRFGEDLVGPDALVVLDGRLSFDPAGAERVVGLAKTIHRRYLLNPEWQLVAKLMPAERTPVFRIRYGDTTRYSWYLRLPFTRPIHHALAGVVRLETPEVGERSAIELANLTAYHLPRFASRPEHDPRAPQNLLPVGALERRLRHEMGDPRWIRRLIEDHLHEESQS